MFLDLDSTGSGCNGVNFPYISLYGAVFWICSYLDALFSYLFSLLVPLVQRGDEWARSCVGGWPLVRVKPPLGKTNTEIVLAKYSSITFDSNTSKNGTLNFSGKRWSRTSSVSVISEITLIIITHKDLMCPSLALKSAPENIFLMLKLFQLSKALFH